MELVKPEFANPSNEIKADTLKRHFYSKLDVRKKKSDTTRRFIPLDLMFDSEKRKETREENQGF